MADTTTQSWKLLYEAGRQALQLRKFQEAEQSFSAALQLAEDFAAGDPRLAATLNALARIYSLQRRYLAAAALLNRLLESTERALGPSHVQVAGVLTNLAEMYTHLGATREELELRERVLAIREDDANSDPTALARLRERVDELRLITTAEERAAAVTADQDDEPAEDLMERIIDRPVPAELGEPRRATEPVEWNTADLPRIDVPGQEPPRREAPRLSDSAWATGSRPAILSSAVQPVQHHAANALLAAYASSESSLTVTGAAADQPGVSLVLADDSGTTVSMGYPYAAPLPRSRRGRLLAYSAAAAVVLVAGVAAARGVSRTSDDGRVSGGAVSLASTSVAPPPAVVVLPPAPKLAGDAERREAAQPQSSEDEEKPARRSDRESEAPEPRAPRPPANAELERALKAVDGAVRTIDQRTRAAAESATAVRIQGPVFKQVKVADP